MIGLLLIGLFALIFVSAAHYFGCISRTGHARFETATTICNNLAHFPAAFLSYTVITSRFFALTGASAEDYNRPRLA